MTKLNTFSLVLMMLGILYEIYGCPENPEKSQKSKKNFKKTESVTTIDDHSLITFDEQGIQNRSHVKPAGFGEENVKEFRNKILQKCNEYRSMHNSPQLELNENLENIAQKWANVLATNKIYWDSDTTDLHEHKVKKFGENTFRGYRRTYKKLGDDLISDAVNSWYLEIGRMLDYPKEITIDTIEKGYGYATQLLWKSSKYIGIGVSKSPKKNVTFVCVYFHPRGNLPNNYEFNVPKIEEAKIKKTKKELKKFYGKMDWIWN